MRLTIHSDGGARGNPGPAAAGVVITDENNKVVAGYGEYLGEQTNNFAEYSALISGLKRCHVLGATEVECVLDSELVVKQMQGVYKVRDAGLQKLFVQAYNAAQKFKKVTYHHTARANNMAADKWVNDTLDKRR